MAIFLTLLFIAAVSAWVLSSLAVSVMTLVHGVTTKGPVKDD